MGLNLSKNINILYVEDDEIVKDSIQRSLSLFTNNVFSASNGKEALEILQIENNIDLIITDIRMPQIDGLEMVQQLRNNNLDIPVIVTTAFNELEYLQKAIELHVDKFVRKPVNLKELFETIEKTAQNIINRKELEKRRVQLETYKNAIEATNLIIKTNINGDILTLSKNLSSYFKENYKEILELSKVIDILEDNLFEEIKQNTKNYQVFSKVTSINFCNDIYTVNLTVFPSTNEEYIFILKDLTQVLEKKDQLIKNLQIEPITNLKNRYTLYNTLKEDSQDYSLLILDIDNFKKYVQMYGYSIGDNFLRLIAQELLKIKKEKKNIKEVYKIDSDKFVILVKKDIEFTKDKFNILANEIIKYIESHTLNPLHDLSIEITITVGGVYTKKEDLLTEAMISLDTAKKNKKPYNCYDKEKSLKDDYTNNLLIQRKIRKALEKDLIKAYFQPIVDSNKNIMKYEALARVIDPDDENNILTPYHFLDIVQHSKDYTKFTKEMIKKAIEGSNVLNTEISINLSFEDIVNPEITEFLEENLKKYKKERFTIELLEYEGLKDIKETIRFCVKMKSLGAKIAIDDFGSGYSNYEYFFLIPIDKLKIDGSLVKRVHEYKGFTLLESIIQFCKKSQIKVIAEFVEDESIFNKLKELGVDLFQGYYFDKPKSLEDLRGK